MRTTFRWSNRARAKASRRNRSWQPGRSAQCGGKHFMATCRMQFQIQRQIDGSHPTATDRTLNCVFWGKRSQPVHRQRDPFGPGWQRRGRVEDLCQQSLRRHHIQPGPGRCPKFGRGRLRGRGQTYEHSGNKANCAPAPLWLTGNRVSRATREGASKGPSPLRPG